MIATARFTGADGIIVAVIVVLVAFSGLLALAETGLTRTSRHRAMALEEEGRRGAKRLLGLVEHPQRFLNPVILLVLICQLVSATLVGVIAGRLLGPWGVVGATAFEILIIFVFAEAVPKNWAVRSSDRAALAAAPLVSALVALPPVRWLSSLLIKLSNLMVPSGKGLPRYYVTEQELLAMADVAVEEEAIEVQEREMIHSVFEFGDTVVREVMTPRPDMLAVDGEACVKDIIKIAIAAGYSRLPIYGKNVDDIQGIVYLKDLVLAEWDGKSDQPVREIAREAKFVPETKKLSSLMREMQAQKYHMAIVVDEYGGTAGLVTIEDLVEEVFGEITDEFDVEERSFEVLPSGEYRVAARMPLDELNDRIRAALPEGDWDTVGGLMAAQLDHIPVEGESVVVDGYELVAERVKGNRIGRVRIAAIVLPPDEESDEEPARSE